MGMQSFSTRNIYESKSYWAAEDESDIFVFFLQALFLWYLEREGDVR